MPGFQAKGLTVCISVTATSSTAVQVPGDGDTYSYLITNSAASANIAFVTINNSTAGLASSAAVSGTPGQGIPVDIGKSIVINGPQNAYLTAICGSGGTATVYATPGDGG